MPDIKLQSEYIDLDKYKNLIGRIFYYIKNTHVLHNPYGPAVFDIDGYKSYYIQGKHHRLDGPARIWPNGDEEYWLNDIYLTKEQFEFHPERLKLLGKEHLICLK